MLQRIRALSEADLRYRLRRRAQLQIMRWGAAMPGTRPFESQLDPQRFAFCRAAAEQLPTLPWHLAQLDTTLMNPAFALAETDWQTTDEGPHWPLRFFNDIEPGTDHQNDDIQALWHRSRLQELVTLGLIAKHSDSEAISHQAANTLSFAVRAWRQQNPWLRSVNYQSTMECALRLIAVCHGYDLSRQRLTANHDWADCLWLIRSHTHFIERRLCRFSATGNHSVIEAGGLVYSAVLFPELAGSKQRLTLGLTILDQESTQILPDGGNREQSLCYLHMMVEMYELLGRLLTDRKILFPESIVAAAQRGSAFLGAVSNGSGSLPPVGDSDNGRLLSPYIDLLTQPRARPEQQRSALLQFEQSGYSLIRSEDHGSARFSHGALGSTGYFGHGHADALSVCWAIDDREILIDPGTYRYHGDAVFRRYFRGTSAHNTVTIDDRDQAQQGPGAFDWQNRYRGQAVWQSTSSDGVIAVLARHNGYAGLGVTHWRGLALIDSGLWVIWDRVGPAPGSPSPADKRAALHWHVDAELTKNSHGWQIEGLSQRWQLSVIGGEATHHRGDDARPLGWVSRRYGTREPLDTLEVTAKIPAEFVTVLHQAGSRNQLTDKQAEQLSKCVRVFISEADAK